MRGGGGAPFRFSSEGFFEDGVGQLPLASLGLGRQRLGSGAVHAGWNGFLPGYVHRGLLRFGDLFAHAFFLIIRGRVYEPIYRLCSIVGQVLAWHLCLRGRLLGVVGSILLLAVHGIVVSNPRMLGVGGVLCGGRGPCQRHIGCGTRVIGFHECCYTELRKESAGKFRACVTVLEKSWEAVASCMVTWRVGQWYSRCIVYSDFNLQELQVNELGWINFMEDFLHG